MRHRAFAICSRHMNSVKVALRITQVLAKLRNTLKARLISIGTYLLKTCKRIEKEIYGLVVVRTITIILKHY